MSVSFAFRPRILDALKGYTRARWFADMGAGITVGMLLALTRSRPQGEFADIFKRGR